MLKVGDVVRVHLFDRGGYGANQHECGIVKQISKKATRIYWLQQRKDHWTSITHSSLHLHRTFRGNILEVLEKPDD